MTRDSKNLTMFNHRLNLASNKSSRTTTREMARKLYMSYPTCVLADDPETEYSIRNRYAQLYQVPLAAIHIIGSAKTGFSLIKNKKFELGISDLDIAVVDIDLFKKFWEEAFELSKGFQANRFQDPLLDGEVVIGGGQKRFLEYLQKGIIAPDFLPAGSLRARLTNDSARVSKDYKHIFGKISAFFYASELFFQDKQQFAIQNHWDEVVR